MAQTLSDRNACLMAHHGLVSAGATLAQAMKIAIEIEALCEVYLKTLAVALRRNRIARWKCHSDDGSQSPCTRPSKSTQTQ